jgi:MFS family permease
VLKSVVSTADAPGVPSKHSVSLLALSFYWLPNNLFWTVMLQRFLPLRVADMVGDTHKGTYLFYISALGAVATTVIQLIIGPISDACAARMGRRHPFILAGTGLAAIAILAFALSQNFPALLVSFFCIQLFLNIATGPYQALMPDTVAPARHGLASAYMGGALLVGQLVGGLLVFLAGLLHLATFPILVGIVALLLIGAWVTITYVPDTPASAAQRKPPLEALQSLKSVGLTRYPDFFGLLYSRFFIHLSYATITAFLFYYLQDAIGPKKSASINQGLVILVATLAGLVGTLIVGRFSDTVSKKRLVYLACAILGLGAIVFAFIHSMMLVLVLAFLFGAGWGAFSSVDWALAVNLLPEAEGSAARYMAIWHICMTVPQVIAPMFGPVADHLNAQYGHGIGWRAAMLLTVIYLAIGTALLRRVKERVVEVPEMSTGTFATSSPAPTPGL